MFTGDSIFTVREWQCQQEKEVQTEGMKGVLGLRSVGESWPNKPSATERQTEGRVWEGRLCMVIRNNGEWIAVTETSFQS